MLLVLCIFCRSILFIIGQLFHSLATSEIRYLHKVVYPRVSTLEGNPKLVHSNGTNTDLHLAIVEHNNSVKRGVKEPRVKRYSVIFSLLFFSHRHVPCISFVCLLLEAIVPCFPVNSLYFNCTA